MMEHQLATDQFDQLPTELSSPQAKLVYLYLDATGGTTVADLKETLSMQKIAILSVLSSLSKQDLVAKDGETYVPLD
ncbi:MarR family transcriptional regulator [Halosolutus halophilus]|uniref:MarR family transcriptional regulator n=1 Tax=Halosolutus halophilus TaxID=1552990 RepID=UPI0022351798|nr:MarR family transcriptional regulator [Halosolutus halophilus]